MSPTSSCPHHLLFACLMLSACVESNAGVSIADTDAATTDASESSSEESTGTVGDESGTSDEPPVVETFTVNGSTEPDPVELAAYVTLHAEVSDDFGVAAVEFRVAGELIGSMTEPPYNLDWEVRSEELNGNRLLSAVAIDAAGNETESSIVALSIDLPPPGENLWVNTYDHAAQRDTGHDVAVGPDGSVVAVGTVFTNADGRDVWVRKYTPGGDVVWTSFYDGPASQEDQARAVVVNEEGAIFVTGHARDVGTALLLQKLSAAGQTVWTHDSAPFTTVDTIGHALTLVESGEIIVVGTAKAGPNPFDIWVSKHDSSGNLIWNQKFEGLADQDDRAEDVVVDRDGNIIVVGNIRDACCSMDIWTAKLDSEGVALWTRTFDNAGGQDQAGSVILDPDGNIVVVGHTRPPNEAPRLIIRRYSPDGDLLLSKQHDDDLSFFEVRGGPGPHGEILASGTVFVDGEDYFWIGTFASDATLLWQRTFSPTVDPDASMYHFGMTTDELGHFYLTGQYTAPQGWSEDVVVARFHP